MLRMSLEALMLAERGEHNALTGDSGNGFRSRKTLGRGKLLELRVPRSRSGAFYPVLLALLRDQEEECRKVAFSLYGAGLTTGQVGELFQELYGRHYSTSSVSRMFDHAREEVAQWLDRPLEPYYPIVQIDATFIPTHRGDSVAKEAYHTILGVRADRTREVLAVVNLPTESATGWGQVLGQLRARGVQRIGLVVSDGLSAIEDSVAREYPMAEVQLCVVHLKRNMLGQVRSGDRERLSQDLSEVFHWGDRHDTPERAWGRWQALCQRWGGKYPRIGIMGTHERYRLYMTCFGYDHRIRGMVSSTNWVERLNRDHKRATRIRGALPSPEATMLLLGHVAMTRRAYLKRVPGLGHETNKFQWEA